MGMDLAQLRPSLVAMARQIVGELAARAAGPSVRPGTVQGAGVTTGTVQVLLDGEGQSTVMQYLGPRPPTGARVMVLLSPPHGALVLGSHGGPAGPAVATVQTLETTTSTTFADLATVGPVVTLATGGTVAVVVQSHFFNNVAGRDSYMSVAVTGATTLAADYDTVMGTISGSAGGAAAALGYITGLTPGVNTFTMKYAVSGGGATGSWLRRKLLVMPL